MTVTVKNIPSNIGRAHPQDWHPQTFQAQEEYYIIIDNGWKVPHQYTASEKYGMGKRKI